MHMTVEMVASLRLKSPVRCDHSLDLKTERLPRSACLIVNASRRQPPGDLSDSRLPHLVETGPGAMQRKGDPHAMVHAQPQPDSAWTGSMLMLLSITPRFLLCSCRDLCCPSQERRGSRDQPRPFFLLLH